MGLLAIPPLAQAGVIGAILLFMLGLFHGYVQDERYEARIEEAVRIDNHAGEIERRIRAHTENNRRAADLDGAIERLRDGVFLAAPGTLTASGHGSRAGGVEQSGPEGTGGSFAEGAGPEYGGSSNRAGMVIAVENGDRIRSSAAEQHGRAAGDTGGSVIDAIKENLFVGIALVVLVLLVMWRARGVTFQRHPSEKQAPAIFGNEALKSLVIATAGAVAALAASNRIDIEDMVIWRSHAEAQIEELERRVDRLAVSEEARNEAQRWLDRMKLDIRSQSPTP